MSWSWRHSHLTPTPTPRNPRGSIHKITRCSPQHSRIMLGQHGSSGFRQTCGVTACSNALWRQNKGFARKFWNSCKLSQQEQPLAVLMYTSDTTAIHAVTFPDPIFAVLLCAVRTSVYHPSALGSPDSTHFYSQLSHTCTRYSLFSISWELTVNKSVDCLWVSGDWVEEQWYTPYSDLFVKMTSFRKYSSYLLFMFDMYLLVCHLCLFI